MKWIIEDLKQIFGEENLNDFFEEEIDVFCGSLIACGAFTGVIELNYLYTPEEVKKEFKNPVLIISKEKEKHSLVKNVLNEKIIKQDYEKLREESLKDWLNENDYASEEEAEEDGEYFEYFEYENEFSIEPFLNYIESEYGFNIFFMEKLNSETETVNEEEFELILNSLEELLYKDGYSSDYKDIKETDSIIFLKNLKEEFDINSMKVLKFARDIFIATIRDIKKIAKILDNNYLSLDLHTKQYIFKNNNVYCLDPFFIKES